ncbi:MAG: hypothetical protein RIR51_760 [Bacteroidota bacterium]|jgi:hypothetical protein
MSIFFIYSTYNFLNSQKHNNILLFRQFKFNIFNQKKIIKKKVAMVHAMTT